MYKIFLILATVVQNALCYYMPLHEDMGKSLEPLMNIIRDMIVFIPDLFPKPEPVAEKPFYSGVVDFMSELYTTQKPLDEDATKPILICNSFVLLTLMCILFSYIMFAKKYFSTSKYSSDTGIPFMDEEDIFDGETDFPSTQSSSDLCFKCKFCMGKPYQD